VSPPSTDAQRFEALYRAHYAAIVRFVHRRIDPASAEEVIADTFAIAWRRLDDVPAADDPALRRDRPHVRATRPHAGEPAEAQDAQPAAAAHVVASKRSWSPRQEKP
jgi:hypothetical protein